VRLDVFLSPGELSLGDVAGRVVAVIDVLRASTTISFEPASCAAFSRWVWQAGAALPLRATCLLERWAYRGLREEPPGSNRVPQLVALARRAVHEGAELSLGQAIALESRLAERAILTR